MSDSKNQDEQTNALAANATGFSSMSGDEGSVTRYSVAEQIAALKFQRSNCSGGSRDRFLAAYKKGFRRRVNPPSGMGD